MDTKSIVHLDGKTTESEYFVNVSFDDRGGAVISFNCDAAEMSQAMEMMKKQFIKMYGNLDEEGRAEVNQIVTGGKKSEIYRS